MCQMLLCCKAQYALRVRPIHEGMRTRASEMVADRRVWRDFVLPLDRLRQVEAARVRPASISLETAERIALPHTEAVLAAMQDIQALPRYVPLTTEHLMGLHKAQAIGPAGLRTNQVNLRRADGSVSFYTAPPHTIAHALEAAFALSADYPSLRSSGAVVAWGALYAALNKIHPFVDGNGRTSRRLLLALWGREWGVDLSFIPIDILVWVNRTYHDHLLSAAGQDLENLAKSWSEWLAFLAQLLDHALFVLNQPS
jgi:fido (protein-threonine AMPylation protein)